MGNEYLTEKAIELADKISEQLNEEEPEIYLDCDDYKIIVEALRNNYREKSKWVYNQESRLSYCEKCGYEPMHGYWGEQDLSAFCPGCGSIMGHHSNDYQNILGQVRDEIAALKADWDKYDDWRKKNGLYYALKIVDKYIGKQNDK